MIELFTSQGCSSCPPAQANINALADRPDLLPLSFSVTYWDYLGWKDRFAQPAFTQRQRDYDAAGHREVATPQVILDGRFAIVGSDRAALGRAIATADRGARGPAIASGTGHVEIGAAPASGDPATIWLVRYDPRTLAVAVGAGENAGRTLPHRNVVRSLQAIGRWNGPAQSFALPRSPDPAWRSAILVQRGLGGPILAAARIDDPAPAVVQAAGVGRPAHRPPEVAIGRSPGRLSIATPGSSLTIRHREPFATSRSHDPKPMVARLFEPDHDASNSNRIERKSNV